MKYAVQVISVIAQAVIGVLILVGVADLKAVAWYWVISGSIAMLALMIAGLILAANRSGE